MFYNIYQLWQLYRFILHLHGIYVAYSFLCWSLGYTYTTMCYFISFFYINEPIKQIEDKKNNLDSID